MNKRNKLVNASVKKATKSFTFHQAIVIKEERCRTWMIHTATPPASPKLHRTSLYIKISERFQKFFGKHFLVESIVDQNEYKRFLKVHQNGELFGLTVFNPIGKEDHIIAGVQFKRSM